MKSFDTLTPQEAFEVRQQYEAAVAILERHINDGRRTVGVLATLAASAQQLHAGVKGFADLAGIKGLGDLPATRARRNRPEVPCVRSFLLAVLESARDLEQGKLDEVRRQHSTALYRIDKLRKRETEAA